jgi:Predicted AAA-ATPase/PD-(D/E)XK nuclease superfamily
MEKAINRNYPISSHYFPNLIENDAIYVDKTQFIVPLLEKKNNATYFLSRPRRFGKSLFVSALEHVFRGQQDLFKGLFIYDKIEWAEFPVIRLSLDKIGFVELGLEQALLEAVQGVAKTYDITLERSKHNLCFEELIVKLFNKYQKNVVILVDEYDKPIIYHVEKDNVIQAEINRDILKNFYGILKDSGQFLRFTFLTGVSKFSKVSIFSDLNQFDDLTLDSKFMTICGFTEAELRHYCGQGLIDLAEKEGSSIEVIMDKIRFWYNGFSWNATDFVYNPFSTMLLMGKQEFKNYWFESGTPTFLVKLINADVKYDFSDTKIDSSIYSWHDLKNLDYLSIMLQTGYLTFKEHIVDEIYKVNYPNKEVEDAFSKMLLEGYTHTKQGRMSVTILDIETAFKRNDVERVIEIVANMFKTLPLQFFAQDVETLDKQGNIKVIKKAVNENFYHAIIYLIFSILGIKMPVEVSTNEGRIDAVVETDTHIYIFEFKKNRKPAVAIQQMKDRNYAAHYSLSKKQIVLVGVCFTMQKRGISGHAIQAI